MHKVIVVCFGEKSTRLISECLNELKLDNVILMPEQIPDFEFTHVILSGGPKHVYEDSYLLPKWIIENNKPVLGICYGMQLIAKTFNGIVVPRKEIEIGLVLVEKVEDKNVRDMKWMNRLDEVVSIPDNFCITERTVEGAIASFTDYKKWWSVQYHPESQKYRDLSIFSSFINTNSH